MVGKECPEMDVFKTDSGRYVETRFEGHKVNEGTKEMSSSPIPDKRSKTRNGEDEQGGSGPNVKS